MKRLVQFVASMVIAVLAGLPAAEGLACSMHMVAQASACPMGMSEMGPDCPMSRDMAKNCEMDCCNHAVPPIAATCAAPTKPKAVAIGAVAAIEVDAPAAMAAPAGNAIDPSMAASPPRYILNRVFRI